MGGIRIDPFIRAPLARTLIGLDITPPEADDGRRPTDPRHHDLRRCPGAQGLRAEQDVLLLQRGRQPRRLQGRRGGLLPQVRPERAAMPGGARAQRARAARRRRPCVLPGQVRRHLRPRRAGHRRAADRHEQGRIQGPAGGRREELTMATLVGGITTSHVPIIGRAIARNLQGDPYFKPFFDGFPPLHDWLATVKPDVAVVFSNDHGLNFFLDKMPTFAVGAAPEYRNADEGWGIPTLPAIGGELDLSWHLIETLVEREFDVVSCQEMVVDHAVTLPLKLLWPEGDCPVQIVPICINTVQLPLPTARRTYALGRAVGEAIHSWSGDKKVLVIASGGLSHQLDGERAGFINKSFDQQFMDSLVDNPTWITQYTNDELVELTGTQGIELLMWVAARGILDDTPVRKRHSHYHVPISNTATG